MTKPKKKKNESIEAYNERASKAYYNEGYHIKEIAEKLKIDQIVVYNYVTTGNKITTNEEREEMIALFNKGYSYTAIAKIFGKSRACVKERIEKPAKITCSNNNTLTDKQFKTMKEMANNGEYIETIAKEIGAKTSSVRYRLSHTDIYKRNAIKRVTKAEINKFIRLYKKGKTQAKIAKICGRGRNTVNRHLHKEGYWKTKEK